MLWLLGRGESAFFFFFFSSLFSSILSIPSRADVRVSVASEASSSSRDRARNEPVVR